jgi:hypothetical protein
MKPAPRFRRLFGLNLLCILCPFVAPILLTGFVPCASAQQPAAVPDAPAPQLSNDAPPPPAKPQITYDDTNLTITADNATLSEILAAVRERTNADIDIPPAASAERIPEVRLGPGPSRDVLGTLLGWTNFDYIMQAPDENPFGIKSVVLFARDKGQSTNATNTPVSPVPLPTTPPPAATPNLSARPRLSQSRRVWPGIYSPTAAGSYAGHRTREPASKSSRDQPQPQFESTPNHTRAAEHSRGATNIPAAPSGAGPISLAAIILDAEASKAVLRRAKLSHHAPLPQSHIVPNPTSSLQPPTPGLQFASGSPSHFV